MDIILGVMIVLIFLGVFAVFGLPVLMGILSLLGDAFLLIASSIPESALVPIVCLWFGGWFVWGVWHKHKHKY